MRIRMQAYRMSRFICFFDQRPAISFAPVIKKVAFTSYSLSISSILCVFSDGPSSNVRYTIFSSGPVPKSPPERQVPEKGTPSGSGSFLSLPFRCFFRLPLRFSLSPFLCAFLYFQRPCRKLCPLSQKTPDRKAKLIPVVSPAFFLRIFLSSLCKKFSVNHSSLFLYT